MTFKLYTGKGDKGDTGLFGTPDRIPKHDPRLDAIGDVDELNSFIGITIAAMDNKFKEVKDLLIKTQNQLFELGADLATPLSAEGPKIIRIKSSETSDMEKQIDRIQAELKPITKFVLPGGTSDAARLHYARAVCRRAERKAVLLSEKEDINPESVRFLNRLSSLLFGLARLVNQRSSVYETVWESEKP
jgi:cob(I)alamin adenosyltransferase